MAEAWCAVNEATEVLEVLEVLKVLEVIDVIEALEGSHLEHLDYLEHLEHLCGYAVDIWRDGGRRSHLASAAMFGLASRLDIQCV